MYTVKRKDGWKRSRTPPRPRNEAARDGDEGEKRPEENSRNPSARYLVNASNPVKRRGKKEREGIRASGSGLTENLSSLVVPIDR